MVIAEVWWIFNWLFFFVGLVVFLGFPKLRKSGRLYVEEEIGYGVWAVAGLAFYYVYAESGRLFPYEMWTSAPFVFRLAEGFVVVAGLLVAVVLQLRANAKKTDSGPTHPKDEPYEGGGQAYPWEDGEQ